MGGGVEVVSSGNGRGRERKEKGEGGTHETLQDRGTLKLLRLPVLLVKRLVPLASLLGLSAFVVVAHLDEFGLAFGAGEVRFDQDAVVLLVLLDALLGRFDVEVVD